MRLLAIVLYLFTFVSFATAYIIPFRPVSSPEPSPLSPSENRERRHLIRRRRHSCNKPPVPPASTSALFLAESQPLPTSSSLSTSASPTIVTTGTTTDSTSSTTTPSAAGSTPQPAQPPAQSPAQPPADTTNSTSSTTAPSATGSTPQPSQPPAQPPADTTNSTSSTTTPSAAGSTAQPSQPPVDNSGTPKYVVAHHMVGNTYPYTLEDWAEDIQLASASGLDGFALNMGTDEWQPARVADAYQAAEQSGLNFKLFLSLDMTSFPCASPDDATTLRNLVTTYMSHPNQLLYDNRAFVATFSGESCNFGQGSVPAGWQSQFSQHPDLSGKIFFVPSFFVDPTTFTDYANVMDGEFNWNSAWPIEVTTAFAQNLLNSNGTNSGSVLNAVSGSSSSLTELEQALENAVTSSLSELQLSLGQFIGSTTTDQQYLDGLAAMPAPKRVYMGSVSPWFFTHYGPDSYNKNFVYLSDQHLYSKRWESIINSRDQFDLVEVLTWNDYGESHYVGPIKGAQPDSQAWTNGMNHTAWLELTQYYATAYKTGSYPAIEKDKIVMWSRPHSVKAQAPDPVPQPTNFDLYEDAVWAVVMTTAPSTVTLTTSSTTSSTFQVPAGVSKLLAPISPGGFMQGVIERNGQTVVQLQPESFTFEANPPSYNFNAFVASATAD